MTSTTKWEKEFKKFWKPLLKTKGKWDEKKISNELQDLVFIFEQIGEVYCHITGGLLSKPMYYSNTIISHYDDEITKAFEEGEIDKSKDLVELIEGMKKPMPEKIEFYEEGLQEGFNQALTSIINKLKEEV